MQFSPAIDVSERNLSQNADCKYIEKALVNFRENLGEDYINLIGKNMTLISKLDDLAISYSEDEV